MKPASEIIAPFLKAIGYTGKATANASVYPEDLETLIILIEEERIAIKQQADRHLLDQAVRYENELARWQHLLELTQIRVAELTVLANQPRSIDPFAEAHRQMLREAKYQKSMDPPQFVVPAAGFINKGTP